MAGGGEEKGEDGAPAAGWCRRKRTFVPPNAPWQSLTAASPACPPTECMYLPTSTSPVASSHGRCVSLRGVAERRLECYGPRVGLLVICRVDLLKLTVQGVVVQLPTLVYLPVG